MEDMTRKEIAAMLGVSVQTVERREEEWGLTACRCRKKRRPVLYFREKVEKALKQAGLT